MPYHQKLSTFITSYIKENHISKSEFAKITGVSLGTVTNYINQSTEPEIIQLYRISIGTKTDVFGYILKNQSLDYMNTIDRVRECKLLLERIEEEITGDMIKNLDLASMVHEDLEKEAKEYSDDDLSVALARCIKNYVHTKKITYSELAKKVGLDKSQISQYINGSNIPSLQVAIELSKIMNIPIQELIGLKIKGESELDYIYSKLLEMEDKLIR